MCTSVIDMTMKTQQVCLGRLSHQSRAPWHSADAWLDRNMCARPPIHRLLTRNCHPKARRPPEIGRLPGRKMLQLEANGGWYLTIRSSTSSKRRLTASNQNIAAAADSFLAARALVRQARAQYWPTVATNPSIVNSRPSPGQLGGFQSSSSSIAIKSYTDYSLPFDASWEPDLWGRVRNTVRASVFAAQASAADVQNVRLSEQAELAVDYYELRAQDSLKQVLDSTVIAYQETLDLTQSAISSGP